MYSEVHHHIFEKKKLLDPSEKSTFQLSQTTMRGKNTGNICFLKLLTNHMQPY